MSIEMTEGGTYRADGEPGITLIGPLLALTKDVQGFGPVLRSVVGNVWEAFIEHEQFGRLETYVTPDGLEKWGYQFAAEGGSTP